MIAEVRACGTSIIIADQSPEKVGKGIVGNTNVKVVFRLVEKTAKDIIRNAINLSDLDYDRAPIQISQFESDIRIAEHLDRIWFERGGGGNSCESYTAAWYMGLHHTSLDCWKRGKKGIIITLGDEPLNPVLPGDRLARITGDNLQGDVETRELYRRALEKFDIFHVAIDDPGDCYRHYAKAIDTSFGRLLGQRLIVSTLDQLPQTILNCLAKAGAGAGEAAAVPAGGVKTAGTAGATETAFATGAAGTAGAAKRPGLFGLFGGLSTVKW